MARAVFPEAVGPPMQINLFFFFHKILEVPLVILIEGKHSNKQDSLYVVFFSQTIGSNWAKSIFPSYSPVGI